jgi:uncharacterized protein
MRAFRTINLIAFILLIIGGIAWLTLGLFNGNIVMAIAFNNIIVARVIYTLVGLSSLWLLFSAAYTGHIGFPWERNVVE